MRSSAGGRSFQFRIKCAKQGPASTRARRSAPLEQQATVLVVDDIPLSRQFLADLLAAAGFDVLTASNGMEALEIARGLNIDLILSDVLMPVMDGFTLCRQIKEDPLLKQVPFAFYTGNYNNPDDVQLGLSLGADLYLHKPMDTKVLTAMLKGILERNKSERKNLQTSVLAEDTFLKAYSRSLVRKLEEQLEQLEKTNSALRTQEAFAQSILDSLNAHIAVLDGSGRVKATNRPWQEFGREQRQAAFPRPEVGADYIAMCRTIESFSGVEGKKVAEGIERVIGHEEPTYFLEYAIRFSEEETRWFQLRALPMDESFGGAVIVHTCITEQKQKVRESEDLYRSLVESLSDHIFLLDMEGRYIATNGKCHHLGFLEQAELLGRTIEEVYPEPLNLLYRSNFEAVRQVKRSIEFEHDLDNSDRKHFHVDTLYPVYKDGAICAVGGICRDITERKKAEQALLESERKFRTLAEGTSMAIMIYQGERWIYANRAAEELTGYSEQELQGMPFWELAAEEFRKEFKRRGAARQNGEKLPKPKSFRIQTKSGTCKWVDATADSIELRGRIAGMLVLNDVTREKQAEQALRESEERFRTLYQQVPIPYQSLDAKGHFLEVNRTWLDSLGYSEEDVIGKWFGSFMTEESAAKIAKRLPCFLERGEIRDADFEMVRRDGSTLIARFSGTIGKRPDGTFRQTHCIFTDITERQKAEEALRESEERYRGYVDNAPTGIFVVDSQGRYLNTNLAASRMTGYSREELAGMTIRDLAYPGSLGDALELFGRLKTDGRAAGELQLRTANGDLRWFMLEAARLSPERYIGFTTDITDQVHARQELVHAKERAEIASKSKSEFLANMSHEMRTPLNGAMAMLQLLKISELSPEQREYVDAALVASTNLTRLLTDILDLSRIEAGLLRLAEEPFEIEEILRIVHSTFKEVAQEKGIHYVNRVAQEVGGRFSGDPVRIRQVLFNLIGNAVKFTEKGSVTLDIELLSKVRPGEERLLFTVTDTGIGIPDKDIPTIFEPFTQVEGTFTKAHGGAGLGLNIVKRLVRLMKGSLAIESEEGNGTKVFFTISLGRPSEVSPVEEPQDVVAPVSARRLLLAEDEKINRMAMRIFLEKSGFEVVCAANGLEVLEHLERVAFDIAILDIQMPLMNGMEAIQIVRSSKKFARISALPIIAMTAYAMTGDRERFLEAGATAYLSKPVDFGELLKTICSLLPS
jgi:PAS domain S-box-containing protein